MRRPAPTAARSLLVAVAVALAVTMSGCVPEPAPTTTATATATPTPTPTPTATGEAVAPGAQPPAIFGGKCPAALASTDIDNVAGTDMTPYEAETEASVANVGGLNCMWTGTDASLSVSILPRTGLGDAQLPAATAKQYFEDCDPSLSCSWLWNEEDLWISGTFQFIPGMSQSEVTAWGQALGDIIAANHVAQPEALWVRDRTGWWPVRDCTDVAAAVGKELGSTVKGKPAAYPRPSGARRRHERHRLAADRMPADRPRRDDAPRGVRVRR